MPGQDSEHFRLLFVEDDERLASMTARYLEAHGHSVTWVADGQQGLAEALKGQHDVLILDLMLPRKSGLEICREVRARVAVPIIMLTALGEEADRVLGLETGADDYLAKPFSSRELLARLRALVRRGRGAVGPPREIIRVGELELSPRDTARRSRASRSASPRPSSCSCGSSPSGPVAC